MVNALLEDTHKSCFSSPTWKKRSQTRIVSPLKQASTHRVPLCLGKKQRVASLKKGIWPCGCTFFPWGHRTKASLYGRSNPTQGDKTAVNC